MTMDTRVKYVEVGGIYAKQGDWVTCESGHFIAMFNRIVRCGDAFDPLCIVSWRQPEPKVGGPMPVCEHCGGYFVRGSGSEFHFPNGWRTVTPARVGAVGWFKKLWYGLTAKAI